MRRLLLILPLAACTDLASVGSPPDFAPLDPNLEHHALYNVPLPEVTERRSVVDTASLWSSSQRSLFGDRRARGAGDILTVVIEINDSAQISNSTSRGRSGSQSMGVPQLFGLPQAIDERLPTGASMADAVSMDSASSFQGQGTVSRNERLTLRVATTIIETLPNGVLRIEGSQEVRVNNELRELIVTGYIRPEDISRRNDIAYDRIAGARISYGGRGQISQMQQPRYGQQIADIVLPF
ncbi:flagellar basal body L-ring protein FlgH [Pararhodobacter zhoushanensis]|uniref:Flagellar L-ring protein n=1 Tax=Pararhodobacter zhoushanensis TaxID=2479545 RepID=A0ABT3GTH1_9RHOB|nr:flagellar basal body L-ring protein FlgH [Pararhodobacter zhoushanensis]MCW1930830.1 flagellar basal body L-ring protein FlgH [Pararhodobacter zhoushanensis]